jgi:hypothetical protein
MCAFNLFVVVVVKIWLLIFGVLYLKKAINMLIKIKTIKSVNNGSKIFF